MEHVLRELTGFILTGKRWSKNSVALEARIRFFQQLVDNPHFTRKNMMLEEVVYFAQYKKPWSQAYYRDCAWFYLDDHECDNL